MSQSPQRVQRPLVGRLAIVAFVLGVSMLAVPDARSAVTIGSDLSGATDQIGCGAEPCTAVQTVIPGRTVASPINGVVVRWRVANASGTLTLRVVRDAGGGNFTGVGRSATGTVTTPPAAPGQPPAVTTFDTRLPISAGDYGGLDFTPGALVGLRDTAGAQGPVFFPPLGDNETRAPDGTTPDAEGLANADVEPDADRDGYGDETQDLCAKDATTQSLCKGPCANDRNGTENPDTVNGTEAGDKMLGLGGDDRLTALAGDDCVFGGAGRDTIRGDAGTDRLDGEAGPDSLRGGDGDDTLSGGDDADSLNAGAGTDKLSGGLGGDALAGSDGDDTIRGDEGSDRLTGGDGLDVLSGGPSRDTLVGGAGNDRLNGGPANDVLRGGAGRDVLRGTGGNDSIRGNAGNDRITGGAGRDKIDVGAGRNRASGGAGRDVIRARNHRRDRIACGSGRDKVVADAADRVGGDCEVVTIR
jgi:Ca2+-binding RTX toxin-like protein